MQEIRTSNPPVVTRIYNLNVSRARYHPSLKLDSKLKYLNSGVCITSLTKSSLVHHGVKSFHRDFEQNLNIMCVYT